MTNTLLDQPTHATTSQAADGRQLVRVGHVMSEFCERISMFNYRLVASPYAQGMVFCDRRTNAELYPLDALVVSRRWSRKLKSLAERRCSKRLGAALGQRLGMREWQRFLTQGRPQVLHAQYGDEAMSFMPFFRTTKLPLIVTFWGSDINTATYRNGYVERLRELFERSSICHFVSQALCDAGCELGCDPQRARVLYMGTEIPQHSVDYENTSSACRFACVARLVPGKGHETVIRAFRRVVDRFPEASLELFGDGPLRDRLRWIVQELRLERHVRMRGTVPYPEVQSALAHSVDVLILASRTDDQGRGEGLPVSLTEGAALGLPLVGTRCGGIPELVRPDETGLLVEQRSDEQLGEALCRLAGDAALRERLGRAARRLACEQFDADKQLKVLADLYRQAVDRAR